MVSVKRKHSRVIRVNRKALRKIATAFALVVLAVGIYIKAYPYTHDAQVKRELESTSEELMKTRDLLENTTVQSQQELEAKQKELEELNKKLEETQKALQAKRNKAVAYALERNASYTPPKAETTGTCVEWMAQANIPLTVATQNLIIGESGCNPNAYNKSSGACGIPQALPCSKLKSSCPDMDPVCQLRWMDNYVAGRYDTWENAYSTWLSRYPHWY